MRRFGAMFLGAVTALMMTAAVPAPAQQPQFNWRRYAGSTITFLSENHPWPSAVLPYLDEFKKLTGINVRIQTFNEDQSEQRLGLLLQEHSPDIDVYMSLKEHEGQLYFTSGWYRDLWPMINDPTMTAPGYDFADFPANLVGRSAYKGEVVTIPLNFEGPVIEYRKDVFAACHLQPPRTMEEIEPIAARLKACRPDLAAWVSRGLRDALPYTFVPFYYNLGGSNDKAAEKQDYCSPIGAKTIAYYTDLLDKYGPPGVSNYTFYQITDLLGQGRAAFAFTSSNEFGKLMAYPHRAQDIGILPLPPGAESHVQKPLVIDWGIAISAFSKNPGPAWYFVQWATSQEMDQRLMLKGIASPRRSVLGSPETAKWVAEQPIRAEWIAALNTLAAKGVDTEVPAAVVQVPRAQDVMGAGVQSVMLGQASAAQAGCQIDDGIAKLLGP